MNESLESHLRAQTTAGDGFFWHRLRWRAVSSGLPQGRPFRLLDVGAGAGLLGRYLAQERPEATYCFTEPIPSLEERLERRFGAAANRAGSDRLDDIDVVTLLDVIEHVEDDHGLLADLTERTSPGTTFIITVPARRRLWSAWDVSLGHHRRYERHELRALLARLPLRVREVSFLFPELVPAARLRARRRGAVAALDPDGTEFPRLPRLVDRALVLAGTPGVRLRRFWWTGTSLIALAERTGGTDPRPTHAARPSGQPRP